jgi:hypothetical protein
MPKTLLMDELHVTVSAPAGLAKARYQAIQRVLRSGQFHARLRQAVQDVLGRYPSLQATKPHISR